MKKSIFLYIGMWLVWSVWSIFATLFLPVGALTAVMDSVLMKALVWVLPLALLKKLHWKELFQRPFPWLVCVVTLCAATAFLHTLRLINGLQNTHAIFDPMFILFSLSAGVLEELSFRGGFFAWQERQMGFWPSTLVNGALFMLYHYPELMLGQWQGLISLRPILIFTMGIVFCWMFKRWRNLALNMTVHTVWNILSYLFCLTG